MEVIKLYRQVLQLNPKSSKHPPAAAVSLQGRTPDPRHPTSRNPSPVSRPYRECICGSIYPQYKCYYLREEIRHAGWKPNAKISKKVEEALKNLRLRSAVDKQKQRWKETKEKEKSTPSSTEQSTQSQVNRTFVIIQHRGDATDVILSSYSVDRGVNYEIFNCQILDSGSNIHIYNDLSRFKTTHATISNDYLISGSTTYLIKAYRTVNIYITSPSGMTEEITLSHVTLVPGFFTNLVLFSRAKEVGIY